MQASIFISMRRTVLVWVVAAIVATGAWAAQRPASCVTNAKQMCMGMLMYAQDYNEILPPMASSASVQKILMPYIKNDKVFLCTVSGKPFAWNKAMSGKTLKSIKNPATDVVCYDVEVHDGNRVVGYVDGHVKAIPEADFATLKKSGAVK